MDNGAAGTDLDLFLLRDPNGDGNFADAVTIARLDEPELRRGRHRPVPDRRQLRGGGGRLRHGTRAARSTTSSTWLVNDPSGDDPSNPPGLTVTGDGSVTTGVPLTLRMNWSGVNAAGTYLGLISYHATNAPSFATNTIAYTVAEVNKTTTTATGTANEGAATVVEPAVADPAALPQPIGQPVPERSSGPSLGLPANLGSLPSATPAVTAPAVQVARAQVSGRTLTLRLKPGQASTLRASVLRGKRVVARTAARKVNARTASVKLRLNRRLTRGSYTLKVISTLGKSQRVTRVALTSAR